jgi:hypothetical protein
MRGIVCSGGHKAETAGIKELAAYHAGKPGFTFSLAVGPAQGAEA